MFFKFPMIRYFSSMSFKNSSLVINTFSLDLLFGIDVGTFKTGLITSTLKPVGGSSVSSILNLANDIIGTSLGNGFTVLRSTMDKQLKGIACIISIDFIIRFVNAPVEITSLTIITLFDFLISLNLSSFLKL